jgi:hypothetical protein
MEKDTKVMGILEKQTILFFLKGLITKLEDPKVIWEGGKINLSNEHIEDNIDGLSYYSLTGRVTVSIDLQYLNGEG